ncbi:MAG: response regulator [Chloroflexi bacterium]|nr:response regulator [Chloroflexota bacterium]
MTYEFPLWNWTEFIHKVRDIYLWHRGSAALCTRAMKQYRSYMDKQAQHIRVFIVDDHANVLKALASQLACSTEKIVVDTAAGVEEALTCIPASHPDVILVETKRADGRGLELVEKIRHSGVKSKIVVLTSYFNEWERVMLAGAGVKDYLLKDIGSTTLIQHITALAV